MRFAKMHGLGNDYVYVDGNRHPVDDAPAMARWVSDRHVGIGSDGLIVVTRPPAGVAADAVMRMYNADGSEGLMCGNGIRCVAKFVVDRGLSQSNPLRVETRRGVLEVHWQRGDDGSVTEATVEMGAPILECARIPAAVQGVGADDRVVARALPSDFWKGAVLPQGWREACGLAGTFTLVSMGNPHIVLPVAEVSAVPLEAVGPFIERHAWFPQRINVHFVQRLGPNEARMRTWERGSGITMACGTGACAVAVAGVLEGSTGSPLLAHLPGGDLTLAWPGGDASVRMTGPAVQVFEGDLDLASRPVEVAHAAH